MDRYGQITEKYTERIGNSAAYSRFRAGEFVRIIEENILDYYVASMTNRVRTTLRKNELSIVDMEVEEITVQQEQEESGNSYDDFYDSMWGDMAELDTITDDEMEDWLEDFKSRINRIAGITGYSEDDDDEPF